MATDIRHNNWNSTTVDVVAVQGTIDATDRTGTARADGLYDFGVIPKGAIILKTYIDVTEAFDGTTPTLSVGVTSSNTQWFSAASLATKALIAGTLNLDAKIATSEEMVFTLVGGTSTVGQATVYIEYVDTAARREIFTV